MLVLAAACVALLAPVHGGQVVDVDGGPKLPFMYNLTNPFHPSKSLSFAHVLFLGFSLTYADTAGLRGYIAQDVTQLGRYYAKTKFGCITHCDSSDFNGIDGILGLGMPDAALASIPEPLFFALSDETGDPANQYILKRRIFTLVGTDSAAELHLGGFDPHATKHDMKYIKTTSPAEYSVPVSSISLGGHEFLNFASAAQAAGRTSIPGILDSGTSCLVVPDSTLNGLFLESPYVRMMENLQRGEPLYITIGEHQAKCLKKSVKSRSSQLRDKGSGRFSTNVPRGPSPLTLSELLLHTSLKFPSNTGGCTQTKSRAYSRGPTASRASYWGT